MSLADKITISRIIFIPIFVAFLMYSRVHYYLRHAATAVFILAMLSDFFDGLVARIKKEKSEIGTVIDPLADKLLLLTSFICLYALRFSLPLSFKLPFGVVLIVVSRDLIILTGFFILTFLKKEIVIKPSIWGKLTTFFQMGTILAVLTDFPFSPLVWKLAAVFTIVSGGDYFLTGVRALNAKSNTFAG